MTDLSKLNVLLEVPYDYQRDNKNAFASDRQCQCSANYMMAEYVTDGYISERAKANDMREPVDWWALHVAQRGDTVDGLAHSLVWEEMLGIPSTINTDGSTDTLIKMLAMDQPIAIGVHYKGSGHWITVTGVDVPNRMFRCHDPFGSRAGANDWYQSTAPNAGVNDYYSFDLMRRVWSNSEWQYDNSEAGDGHGWYRSIPEPLTDDPDLSEE